MKSLIRSRSMSFPFAYGANVPASAINLLFLGERIIFFFSTRTASLVGVVRPACLRMASGIYICHFGVIVIVYSITIIIVQQ